MKIGFNKPFLTGMEYEYIADAVSSKRLSGNGKYTNYCHNFFKERYGFRKCLLATSCTDALEMAAILINIQPEDEVIIPSYTFVSTANAFVLRGAKIVFADSGKNNPNFDTNKIEGLITKKTKAIVPVHYAGIACDMDEIMYLADKYNLFVIEDAAQAIESYYTGKDGIKRALGSIGHLGAFSFHETKNIISGEGGMLIINDKQFEDRAEIIWEKGTDRCKFFRGEIDKYNWVDVGSSFLPSEIIAAFLWAQLQQIDNIQQVRVSHWIEYHKHLQEWAYQYGIMLPEIPTFATNNAHMFYMLCKNLNQRKMLISALNKEGIQAIFHYVCLHSSPYYINKHDGRDLLEAEKYSDQLIRLPMFYDLNNASIEKICQIIKSCITQ